MIVRRVRPMSAAKVGGMLYAVIGLIYGVIFALFSFLGMGLSADTPGMGSFGMLFGVGAIIIMPIIMGIIGFICMGIGAALYNVAAKLAGGLELTVDP